MRVIMYKIFNISNFKQRDYILLVSAVVLCLTSFQAVLIPSIDYIALSIKNNNHTFYNYAMIATLAGTIPQASSIISGYLVNNLSYKLVVTLICSVIMAFSIVAFLNYKIFILYTIFVISSGVLYNALICSIDKQIVTLLADKIREFQNDIFILCSLMAIINYKLSNLLFAHFGLHGIILYGLLFDTLIFVILLKIKAVDYSSSSASHKQNLPNIRNLIKIFSKHTNLLLFWAIMLAIMCTSSGLTLLLTTKIHHEHLPTALWSSNMSLMALGSVLGALTCKTRLFQQMNDLPVMCIGIACFSLCLISIALSNSPTMLLAILWLCGFINPFILINMNTRFFKYISGDSELIAISPVINGALTSAFYVVCLIGPLMINLLLQIGINYKVLLASSGIIEIILGMVLINVKSLRKCI